MSNVSVAPRGVTPLQRVRPDAGGVVLNGTNVGRVTIEPYAAKADAVTWAKHDKIIFIDPGSCPPMDPKIAAALTGQSPCQGDTLVAHAPSLKLNAFERNVLMIDGRRMEVVRIDDQIQGPGEATRRALKRLPNISSATTVGVVSIGAVATRFALGQRNIKSLVVTGLVAAGIAGAGAVGLSWYRARHPYSLPGWLK
jgi:hypothetical protein